MKRKPLFLLLQFVLAGTLLVSLLLISAAFQSFDSLSPLINRLSADGEFESFDPVLYQSLRLPLGASGLILAMISGMMLYRWKKTELWVHTFAIETKQFFFDLGQDARSFTREVVAGIKSQGRLVNIALAGIMLVAAVVRLANLNIPLGHDEAYMYNAFASRPFGHIITNYHLPNNHVLLSIITKVITRLFGNQVWSLRLPTIFTGVLMVPAAYFFAKRFYSKESALLSSILVAVFPILVQYSVLARGYVIIGLVTLLIFTIGDYVRSQKNRFVWGLIVLLSALGFYTIPIMLFPFGALYLWLFVSWALDDTRSYTSKSEFLRYWLGSGLSTALVTIVLYMPIIIYSFDRFFGNGFIAPLEWDVFPVTIWTRLRNTWIEWTATIPGWIVLIGVVGLLVSLVYHRKFSRQKFSPQLAFIAWMAVLLLARRPDMLPRFWLFLASPMLAWAAAGVVEPLRKIRLNLGKEWSPVQVVIAIIFIFAFAQGLLTIPSLPARLVQKDDMEKAAIFLKDRVHQSDLVTASTARLPALRYYFNYYEIPSGNIRESGKFQRAFIIVDRQKNETLATVAPKMGYDIPAIDMNTAKVLIQFEYLTIYECYPAQ